MTKFFLLAGFCAGLSFAATATVNVSQIGGEATGACSETHTDGTTASCLAALAQARGNAVSSWYRQASTGEYIWFGSLQRTMNGGLNVQVWARALFDSEFGDLTYGQGVTVSLDDRSNPDTEAVNVYANDGYGNYNLVGTLDKNKCSLSIPYAGTPLQIELEAIENALPNAAIDYVATFRVRIRTNAN